MKKLNHRQAFTMIELIFVITIVGILAAIAIPRLAMSVDDATISKAKNEIASIRSSISTERQKRILRSKFDKIYSLSSSSTLGDSVFDAFDGNTSNPVLEYPLNSCETATSSGCWKVSVAGSKTTNEEYTYMLPLSGSVVFELKDNKFQCKVPSDVNCTMLTR